MVCCFVAGVQVDVTKCTATKRITWDSYNINQGSDRVSMLCLLCGRRRLDWHFVVVVLQQGCR
jgi:hypothetical protein